MSRGTAVVGERPHLDSLTFARHTTPDGLKNSFPRAPFAVTRRIDLSLGAGRDPPAGDDAAAAADGAAGEGEEGAEEGAALGVEGETLGFVFLFNPSYRAARANVTLDDALAPFAPCTYGGGAAAAAAAAAAADERGGGGGAPRRTAALELDLVERYPRDGRRAGAVAAGTTWEARVEGSNALVLEVDS